MSLGACGQGIHLELEMWTRLASLGDCDQHSDKSTAAASFYAASVRLFHGLGYYTHMLD